MSEPKIPGGCILIARKIIESQIWDKPPLYMKVWVYLLSRAQHADYKKMKRGQLRASIPEIIEACSWKVGARIERPKKDQIYQILDWLRTPDEAHTKPTRSRHEADTKATMIQTTKATHGLLITIDNYWFYQDIRNYESNNESNDEDDTKPTRSRHERDTKPDNTNKNGNNVKNGNRKTSTRQSKKYAEDSLPYKLASYLHKRIMEYAASLSKDHLVKDANLQKWADECRKMLELDKHDKDEIRQVIDWATTDHFWQKNILSAKKLREKFATLSMRMAGENQKMTDQKTTKSQPYESVSDDEALEELKREGKL